MKESYPVTLILRQNGRVEVYSDFTFTNAFDMSPQNLFCVDIDHDNDFFYMKYLNLARENNEEQFIIRKVAIKWRTKIKFNYTVEVKHVEWTSLNSKFSNYFRLITKFINLSNYFIVAHRHYISVFNMRKDQWIGHYPLGGK